MSKFKVGDRVRITCKDSRVPAGSVGTVLDVCNAPDVKWDNWHGSFRADGDDVWAIFQDRLEAADVTGESA